MGDFCFFSPQILLGCACAIAAILIFFCAREEPQPPWKWGDAPRREPTAHEGMIGNYFGAFAVCFAIAYALNHPLCQ